MHNTIQILICQKRHPESTLILITVCEEVGYQDTPRGCLKGIKDTVFFQLLKEALQTLFDYHMYTNTQTTLPPLYQEPPFRG
jgi:hypothetical protein